MKHTTEWPPVKHRLPSLAVLEEQSQPGGVPRQTSLFPAEVRDQSKAGRINRLLEIPGVTTADTLTGGMRSSSLENGRLLTVVYGFASARRSG